MVATNVLVGDEFNHTDIRVRIGKPRHLRVVKINGTAVVAHEIGDANPWAPHIFYFGLGLFEEEIKWIKREVS